MKKCHDILIPNLSQHASQEQLRIPLEERGLTPDLLLSDSALTDVPEDLSCTCDEPSPLYPPVSHSPKSQDIALSPQNNDAPDLPVENGTEFSCIRQETPTCPDIPTTLLLSQPIKKPTTNPPKLSPYFSTPLVDPDSCLPFPPIGESTFGLVQEQLAHNPFRLLLATIFLNRTRGGVALPVLFGVFERFPTVEAMAAADLSDLVSMIRSLGFQNQRARKCIQLAQTWLDCPPACGKRYRKLNYPCKLDGRDIKLGECIDDEDQRVAWEIGHLPGVGAYSLDSWRIFCRDELRGTAKDWKGAGATTTEFVPEWKSVLPQDKELRAYLTWMWLKEGWIWDRHTGKRTRASDKMMRAAQRGGIAHVEQGNWVLEMSPVKRAV